MLKQNFYVICIFIGLLLIWVINSISVFAYQILILPNFSNELKNINIVLYGVASLLTFPILSITLRINREEYRNIGFDQFYLLIFVFSGILQLYYLPYTIFIAMALIYTASLLFEDKINQYPINRVYWISISLFSIFSAIYVIFYLHTNNFVSINKDLVRFITETLPLSVYEEAIFRGLFVTVLLTLGFNYRNSIIIQGLFFWLVHINYLPIDPLFFWIIIPIISVTLSYIVFRTKSLFLSAIVHIVINYFI